MKYKILGRSGLRVSELCLGTMTFGTDWNTGADKVESRKMFDLFAERGGNFVDTANLYTNGTSEKYLGEFIQGDRERFVVATKYSLKARSDDPNGAGNSRKNMMQSVEASLKRLKTDAIDLYWVHAWDGLTPVDEVMRGLDDLVSQGKVHYVGLSDAPAWIASRANTMADLRGWSPFVALQIEYSLVERTVERELIPMARALDLAVTPWSPLGAGVLTGKYLDSTKKEGVRLAPDSLRLSDRNIQIARAVRSVAEKTGKPDAQVALNWLRAKAGVMLPIVGARNAAQLEQNLDCLEWELEEDHIAALDEASAIELGFPHEFMYREPVRTLILGDLADALEPHRGDTA